MNYIRISAVKQKTKPFFLRGTYVHLGVKDIGNDTRLSKGTEKSQKHVGL